MVISVSDARKTFSEVVDRARIKGERIRLSRNGREVVAVIPIEDLELLEALEDRMDLQEARRILAERPEFIDLDTLSKELGL